MSPSKSDQISVPPLDSVADQQTQLETIQREIIRLLVRLQGPMTAMIWKRDIERFMKSHPYEEIRQKLEEDINTQHILFKNRLQQIAKPH